MNIMQVVRAGLAVFKAGNEMKNSAAWKNTQMIGSFITAVVALGVAFGYDFDLLPGDLASVAVVVAAVVNGLLVSATNKEIGVRNNDMSRSVPKPVVAAAPPTPLFARTQTPAAVAARRARLDRHYGDSVELRAPAVPTRSDLHEGVDDKPEPFADSFNG